MKQPPRRNTKPPAKGKPSFGKAAGAAPKRPFGKSDAPAPKRPFGKSDGPAPKRPFGKTDDAPPRRPLGKSNGPAGRPFGRPGRRGAADEDAGVPERPLKKSIPARPFIAAGRGRAVDAAPRGRGRVAEPSEDFEPEPEETRRPSGRRSLLPALDFDDVVYGVHAVDEALKAGETLRKLYIGHDRERDTAVAALVTAARAAGVSITFENAPFFSRFPYKAHQNVVALGEPFNYISLDEAIAKRTKGRLIVLLDHLTDPHNVGAILRSAECAGAQAAVLPDRRSAGVNATVRKGAAGAASHLPIARVGNLSGAIRALKAAGFVVVGAALEDHAIALNDAPFGDDIALVIGAEGTGLTKLIAKNCDQLVKIPMLGKVQSLNASVAAGILLYEIVRRRAA